MVQSFNEKNFSNSEIGALYKLRRSRSGSYREAFEKFDKDGDLESLVAQLKLIIEEERSEEDCESGRMALRQRSSVDKVAEIFKMAYQSDFKDN